ncbi:hypothetical protein DB88DRAFT_473628 [Papiliotrema laurentii]|uniref:Uncharacterized protein n=1 Tax=Papiliotrema laurentii TaxID=5418 RepID=A0AAD9CVR3_PAPLA|nr:hypothetical protein DB88DRAFT_473628 [Papiliotrema laurentii]
MNLPSHRRVFIRSIQALSPTYNVDPASKLGFVLLSLCHGTSSHNTDKPARVRLKSRVIVENQQDTCRKNRHQRTTGKVLEGQRRSEVREKLGKSRELAEF